MEDKTLERCNALSDAINRKKTEIVEIDKIFKEIENEKKRSEFKIQFLTDIVNVIFTEKIFTNNDIISEGTFYIDLYEDLDKSYRARRMMSYLISKKDNIQYIADIKNYRFYQHKQSNQRNSSGGSDIDPSRPIEDTLELLYHKAGRCPALICYKITNKITDTVYYVYTLIEYIFKKDGTNSIEEISQSKTYQI